MRSLVVHYCYKSNTTQSVSQHLALLAGLPLDATLSLHHSISVMHETGGSKTKATSPHSQTHLGPWMSSYLLPQPPSGARGDVKVLSPYPESGTVPFPREGELPASAPFSSGAFTSFKVCPTLKGFGSLTIREGHWWTVAENSPDFDRSGGWGAVRVSLPDEACLGETSLLINPEIQVS